MTHSGKCSLKENVKRTSFCLHDYREGSGVGTTNDRIYFLFTAFFRSAPAENFGTFLAGILIAAPV